MHALHDRRVFYHQAISAKKKSSALPVTAASKNSKDVHVSTAAAPIINVSWCKFVQHTTAAQPIKPAIISAKSVKNQLRVLLLFLFISPPIFKRSISFQQA